MSTETEEFHVTIDFQSEAPDLTQSYSLIGLETAHPVMRIDRQVYRGTWATNIGTEMMFNEKGEWVTNVAKRLLMEKVEMVRRDAPTEKRGKPKLLRAEDLQDMKAHASVQAAATVAASEDNMTQESIIYQNNESTVDPDLERLQAPEDHEMTDLS